MAVCKRPSMKAIGNVVAATGVLLSLGIVQLLAFAQAGRKVPLQKPAAVQPQTTIKMFGPGDAHVLPSKVRANMPSSIPPLSAVDKQAALGLLPPSVITLSASHPIEPTWATLEYYQPALVRPCCFVYLNPSGSIFLQLQAQANRTYYFDLAVKADPTAGCKYTVSGPDATDTEFSCAQEGTKGQHLIFGFTNSGKAGLATFVFQCSQPASLYSWEISIK